jgi:hypothetical protein
MHEDQNLTYSNCVYTASRCRKDNTTYGPIHGSMDSGHTLCGQEMDHRWFILTNAFNGVVTCKRCLQRMPKSLSE